MTWSTLHAAPDLDRDRPYFIQCIRLPTGDALGPPNGGELIGLAIIDEPGIRAIEPAWSVGGEPGVDPVYYMGYDLRLATLKDQARQLLNQFASSCDREGVAHSDMIRIGSPYEQIELEARTCDLLVLGRGSQFRFIAGDDEADETLEKVLKVSPRPVVVAPASTVADGPVLIAFDGSLQACHALEAFLATGLAESGKVHVISVNASHSEATQHATQASKFLGDRQVESVLHAISSSSAPAEAILELARRLNASLIVMGAYGQPVMREFFLGSVTRTLLDQSLAPLFLYH